MAYIDIKTFELIAYFSPQKTKLDKQNKNFDTLIQKSEDTQNRGDFCKSKISVL